MTQVAGVFSNRYEVQRDIARGGMAQVYLARDQLLDRPVAIKVLFPEFARDPSFVERFRREAQAAANLNHPNIVSIYDWGQERGTYFIVMEYVEGRSLREVIRSSAPLPPPKIAEIGAEIAGALAFAHRNGVVHRDIKPGNVLITDGGRVKVTDFGIARAGAGEALTQTGAVMGTATYFSPEQAQGLPVDGRSDVYSLGVVLYEMATGEPPFTGDTPVAVAYKHVREEVVPPSDRVPDLPADLQRIILAAMAKGADARYQSADDLRDDLVRFGRGRPPAAAPVTAVVADVPTGGGAAATQAMGAPAAAPEPVYEEEPRRSPARVAGMVLVGLIGALLVALLIALIAGVFTPERDTAARIAVPAVVDKSFGEAELILKERGFKVRRVDRESNAPADQVLEQDPPEGQKLEKGKTVRLVVSKATFEMPNLVGKLRDAAEAQLKQLGLAAESIRVVEEDSQQPPGTVLRTTPPAGADVAKSGEAVELFVAKEADVAIPTVVNLPQAQAERNLRDAGFQVSVQQEASTTVESGRAIRTDPPEGEKRPKGEPVTLFVSSGPPMVDVPDTVGMSQSEAEAALTQAGFNVVVVPQPSTPANSGRVISQSPSGGQAQAGARVTITVGSSVTESPDE
jgi:eukaryotic-like serine/threonine-protein kinase